MYVDIVVTTLHALTLLILAGGYVVASAHPSGWDEQTWATLAGAMIAGMMTLGGGYLAYSAGMTQARKIQEIDTNNNNRRQYTALVQNLDKIENWNMKNSTGFYRSNARYIRKMIKLDVRTDKIKDIIEDFIEKDSHQR